MANLDKARVIFDGLLRRYAHWRRKSGAPEDETQGHAMNYRRDFEAALAEEPEQSEWEDLCQRCNEVKRRTEAPPKSPGCQCDDLTRAREERDEWRRKALGGAPDPVGWMADCPQAPHCNHLADLEDELDRARGERDTWKGKAEATRDCGHCNTRRIERLWRKAIQRDLDEARAICTELAEHDCSLHCPWWDRAYAAEARVAELEAGG